MALSTGLEKYKELVNKFWQSYRVMLIGSEVNLN